MRSLFALALAVALSAPFAARAQIAIPPKLGFSGRLTDSAGVPVPDGSHSGTMTFKDSTGAAIGNPIAIGGSTGIPFITVDGYFALNVDVTPLMGSTSGPPASVDLSYEGGAALPMPIDSVVYAFQAMDSAHLDFSSPTGTIQNGQDTSGRQTLDVNLAQTLKTDAVSCSQAGAFLQRIDYASGTVYCAAPSYPITTVSGGGGGLSITQTGTTVTLSQDSNTVRLNAASSGCSNGTVLMSNGSVWVCGTPTPTGVTSLTAGGGLTASAATGAVTVGLQSCGTGQFLVQNGANSWGCSVVPSYGSPIAYQTGGIVTLAPCSTAGQTWIWNGNAWSCQAPPAPPLLTPIEPRMFHANSCAIADLTVGIPGVTPTATAWAVQMQPAGTCGSGGAAVSAIIPVPTTVSASPTVTIHATFLATAAVTAVMKTDVAGLAANTTTGVNCNNTGDPSQTLTFAANEVKTMVSSALTFCTQGGNHVVVTLQRTDSATGNVNLIDAWAEWK